MVGKLLQLGRKFCALVNTYRIERFLSVHNCLLVILSAERFLSVQFSYYGTQSAERFLYVHIFSLGINQRGFSLAVGW